VALASQTLKSVKELYNYDFGSVYYQLIKCMMSDLRMHSCSEETDASAEQRLLEADSKLDLARIFLLKES